MKILVSGATGLVGSVLLETSDSTRARNTLSNDQKKSVKCDSSAKGFIGILSRTK